MNLPSLFAIDFGIWSINAYISIKYAQILETKMKYLYIIIVLCFVSTFLSGQSYQPCLNGKNIEWNFLTGNYGVDRVSSSAFYIKSDTVINSIIYRKVYVNDEFHSDSEVYGFMREDTSKKKVYFLKKDSIKELIYIDYSLAISDTFYLFHTFEDNFRYPVEKLIVYDIKISNGRKVIKFRKNIDEFDWYFIEGIGTSISLLDFFEYSYYSDLLCSTVDDSLLYKNTVYNTCDTSFSTSFIDLNKNKIKIYPNPFNDHITVNSDQIETIRLFSLAGKLEIESNQPEINTSELTSGLYILELETKSKLLYRGKVVKR